MLSVMLLIALCATTTKPAAEPPTPRIAEAMQAVQDALKASHNTLNQTAAYKAAVAEADAELAHLTQVRQTGTSEEKLQASAAYVRASAKVKQMQTDADNADPAVKAAKDHLAAVKADEALQQAAKLKADAEARAAAAERSRPVIYIADATGSMMEKLDVVKHELVKSIDKLEPGDMFDVVFFQNQGYRAFANAAIPATDANKLRISDYFGTISAKGSTEPVPAIEFTMAQQPKVVYFLTDAADFQDGPAVAAAFKKNNIAQRTKVNTMLLITNEAQKERNKGPTDLMKQIAQESGGVFSWVILNDR